MNPSYHNGKRLFRPLTDLHVEFRPPGWRLPVLEGADEKEVVAVLAGDVGTGWSHLDFVRDLCARHRAVIYVPGNHEYYCKHRMDKVDRRWMEESELQGNLHFLNPGSVRVDGLLVVGAALWTDLNRGDPMVEWAVRRGMNDYNYISVKDNTCYRKLVPLDTMRLNKAHVDFLMENVEPGCFVVTHHAPSFAVKVFPGSRPTDYAYYNTQLDVWMASDAAPGTWLFGHTHQVTDHVVGNVLCVANAAGYCGQAPRHSETDFNPNRILQL